MADLRETFAKRVIDNYETATFGVIKASAAPPAMRSGHPAFDDLEVGARRVTSIATVFLDLSDFTGRSYWDDPNDVATLADSILSGFTEVVTRLDGHVLGLRGDGLFAGFGPGISEESVALAGLAAAAALDATDRYLNPRLKQLGIHPVSARAGLDFGEVTFIRTGNRTTSEVNVVGFAANIAAKSEKVANAWEVVVGEKYAEHINNKELIKLREVKTFTRAHVTHRYSLYDLRWKQLLPELDGVASDLQRLRTPIGATR